MSTIKIKFTPDGNEWREIEGRVITPLPTASNEISRIVIGGEQLEYKVSLTLGDLASRNLRKWLRRMWTMDLIDLIINKCTTWN